MTARAPSYEEVAEDIVAAHNRLSEEVLLHAARSLFNVLGTAAGASHTPSVRRLVRHQAMPGTTPACPGRGEPTSAADAALITAFAAHLDDFDDTHLATVIHPSAACLGAAWASALGTAQSLPAHSVLSAFALGCETQLRLGLSISPAHYDEGWHITGTCGVFGAAVTAALIHGADAATLARALRAASLLTLGHRQAFGTELKPLHAGLAAARGLTAVRHALQPTQASVMRAESEALPTLQPLLTALARTWDPAPLTRLGSSEWQLLHNTFKPYPCGIVAHPGIDAALDIGDGVHVQEITRIDYACHPLVAELMGTRHPTTGLATRFSAVHAVAAAVVHGAAGLGQFSDAAALDERVHVLRSVIRLCPQAEFARDEARLAAHFADGSYREVWIEHARGSAARPLSEEDLIHKTAGLLPAGLPSAEGLWAGMHAETIPSATTGRQLFTSWCQRAREESGHASS
ncbi:MmgE/PrpD family protein [Streptomyces spiralis]|uniref:MmgE/PrpD family protein n=1 Tax=Streptomyces spiralis TaxID=66376 RepID=UPI0036B875B3